MASPVSQPRPAAVAAVLARSSTWTSARRKSDGRPFFIVQGNCPGATYYTDSSICTCPDARERQRLCKHSLAVRHSLLADLDAADRTHVLELLGLELAAIAT